MKKINVGDESFFDFIQKSRYYVDKTSFIKEVFYEDASKVLLITRPRRFGKTLTMDTFYEFLRINPSNPNNIDDTSYQEQLFKDTKIYEDKEFCQEFMGKFPVIFVTFKSVDGKDFQSAYEQLGSTIYNLGSKFNYLIENDDYPEEQKNKKSKLTERQKEQFKLFFNKEYLCDIKNKNFIKDSLKTLTELLSDYHGIKPILLIDEYDVPIAKAAAKGYYEDMIDVMSILLSNALKTNPYLGKAVLTGCLRAAKESIFTGLNNLKVCSIVDNGNPEISKGIGFTKEETEQVLKYYKLDKYFDLVTKNYDGYRFGWEQMYCPWDVMNFCCDNYRKIGEYEEYISAGNYWINSSGNDVIEEYMGYIKPEHVDQMQDLVDGKTIKSVIRTSLCYGDLKNHAIEDFWTLLLYTGYLTIIPQSLRFDETTNGDYICELRIPNNEIKSCFRGKILNFFKQNPLMQNYTTELVKGLFNGEAETVEQNINNLLAKYVSIRDFATNAPKENYYHGFLNGVLTNSCSLIEEQKSNLESGNGYIDLVISSASETEVAIIEIKQTTSFKDDRRLIAQKAIKQINDNQYAKPYINNSSIKNIFAYGICFYKKQCTVVFENFK